MAQARRWCFTLNNYSDEDYENILKWDCKYLIVGQEEGENGTPHLQGYVVFGSMKRLAAMKKLHPRAHFECARGTSSQNQEYCSKEGLFEEIGECPSDDPGAAEKERWKRAREIVQHGGDWEEIPDDIYIRYYRTLKEIKKDHMVKVDDAEDVTGEWYYGPPGVGKSRKARESYPGAYLKMQNKWWDGYQGEEFVILDDMDCKELGHLLKIWADRYAFLAETKGGAIQIRPKKFVVTSNYSIEELFGGDSEMCGAIKRRFHVTHFLPGL